jgi:MFS family permease
LKAALSKVRASGPWIRAVAPWVPLNALWIPLAFQDAALMTIAVPAALLRIAPHDHVAVFSALASIAACSAMVVPPFAGWLSDSLRRRGGSRRWFAAAGVAIDVAALSALAYAHSLLAFAVLLVLATAGANIALSAYQALLPESVPRRHWGAVSGVRGVMTLAGTAVGLGIAGWAPDPHVTFLATAAIMAFGGLSLLAIGEGRYGDEERAHVRDWHDFMVVFLARGLVFFGLILLQTYILYYFRDVEKVDDPSGGTAIYAFSTMLGALASSVCLGILSDRVPRKLVTALAGIPMAIAAIGFAVAPEIRWMLPFAVLFGIGFGGVLSSGWALAMDTIPELRDVARDLGLWGIATNLPNVIAPQVGGWLIAAFHGTRAGYQAVFALAGLSFALASVSVLRVGRNPLSSLYGWPARTAAAWSNAIYTSIAYRIRWWGKIPKRHGPTLVIANHQHDLESMSIVGRIYVQTEHRHPVFTACARRMYEPGFLAIRLPWLRAFLRPVNAGPLFVMLGMLPLENELGSREISSLAYSIQRRHGTLPLSAIFTDRVAGEFPPGTTTRELLRPRFFEQARTVVKLSALREPYRREVLDETRALLSEDLARMQDAVRRGAIFYLTPEGNYSRDGRIGPMRGAIERLAPLASLYVAGVSYDAFAPGRLSMLYRLLPLEDRAHLRETLAAVRPVATSHLLSAWLDGRNGDFTESDALAAVREQLAGLPPALFVDPELRADPDRATRRALAGMTRLGILVRSADRYELQPVRRHPQFPYVDDIVAYFARFHAETLENAAFAAPYANGAMG